MSPIDLRVLDPIWKRYNFVPGGLGDQMTILLSGPSRQTWRVRQVAGWVELATWTEIRTSFAHMLQWRLMKEVNGGLHRQGS